MLFGWFYVTKNLQEAVFFEGPGRESDVLKLPGDGSVITWGEPEEGSVDKKSV